MLEETEHHYYRRNERWVICGVGRIGAPGTETDQVIPDETNSNSDTCETKVVSSA
jgi:hypothetical protein